MPNQVIEYIRYRSAITGHYVSEAYAREHPDTTVREVRKKRKKTSV